MREETNKTGMGGHIQPEITAVRSTNEDTEVLPCNRDIPVTKIVRITKKRKQFKKYTKSLTTTQYQHCK